MSCDQLFMSSTVCFDWSCHTFCTMWKELWDDLSNRKCHQWKLWTRAALNEVLMQMKAFRSISPVRDLSLWHAYSQDSRRSDVCLTTDLTVHLTETSGWRWWRGRNRFDRGGERRRERGGEIGKAPILLGLRLPGQ